jgi:hypothetical protein
MALFAEIRGLADDIILPILDLCDPVGAVRKCLNLNEIAYGYGVCTTDTTNAEVAFDMALHIRTIVHSDDVTATR